MKIDVIGPVNPIRSGASQSTTLLCTNLSKNHDVKAYSFKRMYPKFLYPGKKERYEEDKKTLNFKVEESIDACNPMTWFKTFLKIKNDKPDLIIVKWWTVAHSFLLFSILSLLRLFTKSKICIYCHNILPHSNSLIIKFLTKIVLKRGHYFIVMAKSESEILKKLIPNAKFRLIIDPTYDVCFKKSNLSKKEARNLIGVSGNTMLFFGFVRKYKGLMNLLEAMPYILKKIDIILLIVGEFWENKENYIKKINQLGISNKIKIFDEFIPDSKVAPYIYVSDVFVLPYESATHSGILQVAYGFEKPVIATKVGGLTDFIIDGKNGFLVPPKDPIALANAVIKFYKEKKEKEFIKYIKGHTKKIFKWNENKEKTIISWDN